MEVHVLRHNQLDESFQRGEQKGFQLGLKEGKMQGMSQGRMQGRHMGLVEGREIGHFEAKQNVLGEILLMLLEQRFGEVSLKYRRLIKIATPIELKAWLQQVLIAQQVDELFSKSQ